MSADSKDVNSRVTWGMRSFLKGRDLDFVFKKASHILYHTLGYKDLFVKRATPLTKKTKPKTNKQENRSSSQSSALKPHFRIT